MRRLVIVAIVLAVLGGIATQISKNTVEYVQTDPQVVEKEVQVDALEQAVKSAQESAQNDIKSKAQKAYDEMYAQEMKKVELEVIKDFNTKLDARQVELEKETKVY